MFGGAASGDQGRLVVASAVFEDVASMINSCTSGFGTVIKITELHYFRTINKKTQNSRRLKAHVQQEAFNARVCCSYICLGQYGYYGRSCSVCMNRGAMRERLFKLWVNVLIKVQLEGKYIIDLSQIDVASLTSTLCTARCSDCPLTETYYRQSQLGAAAPTISLQCGINLGALAEKMGEVGTCAGWAEGMRIRRCRH
ncbi:hypothetical protein B0H11DRAFT_1905192 [Mycena galericulata]|nr:hypothetical protein B0H11DRAFT_1922564 [Mycena galericulata]KAJ7504576.1 hypothetical protein B0H11DRAFT_1905192 [Mycena galericulata]